MGHGELSCNEVAGQQPCGGWPALQLLLRGQFSSCERGGKTTRDLERGKG